jgi:hypothetical protein
MTCDNPGQMSATLTSTISSPFAKQQSTRFFCPCPHGIVDHSTHWMVAEGLPNCQPAGDGEPIYGREVVSIRQSRHRRPLLPLPRPGEILIPHLLADTRR